MDSVVNLTVIWILPTPNRVLQDAAHNVFGRERLSSKCSSDVLPIHLLLGHVKDHSKSPIQIDW